MTVGAPEPKDLSREIWRAAILGLVIVGMLICGYVLLQRVMHSPGRVSSDSEILGDAYKAPIGRPAMPDKRSEVYVTEHTVIRSVEVNWGPGRRSICHVLVYDQGRRTKDAISCIIDPEPPPR